MRSNIATSQFHRASLKSAIVGFLGATLVAMAVASACARPAKNSSPLPPAPASARTLTVIGTNDFHGRLEKLPLLAGFVEHLRAKRKADGGGLLLVDAGDLFQGTLASNLGHGRAVIQAYNAMGYRAAAIGNHEFDFGPSAAAPMAPQGSLKERLREASFPFLSANLETTQGQMPAWKNLKPSVLVEVAGVPVGLVGGLTEETPTIVFRPYFADLRVRPLAPALQSEALRLRERGARVVIALVHAGGECTETHQPKDLGSCKSDEEIMQVARALPAGLIDVIVAGHTHKAMAHVVAGTAVVEAWANGRGFSQVDLRVPLDTNSPVKVDIHPPRRLCASARSSCQRGSYEGEIIAPLKTIADVVRPAQQKATELEKRHLGVTALEPIAKDFKGESPLGLLMASSLLKSHTEAQVALLNAGGFRTDLPPGPVTYGKLFRIMPFDNRVAKVRLRARELSAVLARHLQNDRRGMALLGGIKGSSTMSG